MDIDDAALHAWVPGLAPAVAGLPGDRRIWRINRSGVRGLLAASSAGLTWSEQGGLVTRPFTDVASRELVGVNGVVLHVHGLLPARLTFPDVRDRDAFEQVLHAQRFAAAHVAPVAAPYVPAPAAPAPPVALIAAAAPTEQLPAAAPVTDLPAAAPVTDLPAYVPVTDVPVTARGRSGPSPFGPPTARVATPQVSPVPTVPAAYRPHAPPAPTAPAAPQARPSSHPPSSSRLRAARLAEERRAGMAPPQAAVPAPPRTAPQHSPVPAAPAGDASSRLRDGLVVAGFLAGVGALLAFFSGQAASQSVQSTGSHVLTYVGYGLVVLGVAAALFTAGRALGGRRP